MFERKTDKIKLSDLLSNQAILEEIKDLDWQPRDLPYGYCEEADLSPITVKSHILLSMIQNKSFYTDGINYKFFMGTVQRSGLGIVNKKPKSEKFTSVLRRS